MAEGKVEVAVRIRPLLDKFGERFLMKCARKAADDTICMANPNDEQGKQHNFAYNYVFDEADGQADVYDAVRGLVDSTLDGHNATIFTYGQTGSGKTHTVLGEVLQGESMEIGAQTGLYMRVLDDLLKYKHANTKHSHVIITLSILEIHNEQIKDLLRHSRVCELSRNRHGDDGVPNLELMEVSTLAQCFHVFQVGNAARSVAPTSMNDQSSRSHAVFMIDVLQQARTDSTPNPPDPRAEYEAEFAPVNPATAGDGPRIPVRRSRLCLVDLAGSERLKKSNAEGATLKETQAINKSLAVLGAVVKGLYENAKFVNYRDSKLTMLLKPSFERENAKVMLITNISPIEPSYQESMSSLRFADRVMALKSTQVFTIDSAAEKEFHGCHRTLTELCADLRIATLHYDLKLHGPKLKTLRNADGSFSKEAIRQLESDHKKHGEDQRQRELDKLVSKFTGRRDLAEQREVRSTNEMGSRLKVDEQELLTMALANDEISLADELGFHKADHKQLKKSRKDADKVRVALQDLHQQHRKEADASQQKALQLLRQIEHEDPQFANFSQLPPDLAEHVKPVVEEKPPTPEVVEEPVLEEPPPAPHVDSLLSPAPTSPPPATTSQPNGTAHASPPTQNGTVPTTTTTTQVTDPASKDSSPGHASSSPTPPAGGDVLLKLEEVNKKTQLLREKREQAERENQDRFQRAHEIASASIKQADSSSDEDDEEAAVLDARRRKELWKLCGLHKSEVAILQAKLEGSAPKKAKKKSKHDDEEDEDDD